MKLYDFGFSFSKGELLAIFFGLFVMGVLLLVMGLMSGCSSLDTHNSRYGVPEYKYTEVMVVEPNTYDQSAHHAVIRGNEVYFTK